MTSPFLFYSVWQHLTKFRLKKIRSSPASGQALPKLPDSFLPVLLPPPLFLHSEDIFLPLPWYLFLIITKSKKRDFHPPYSGFSLLNQGEPAFSYSRYYYSSFILKSQGFYSLSFSSIFLITSAAVLGFSFRYCFTFSLPVPILNASNI
jgi:hypothetical protein